ncbi:MAG: thrombospondin type 3 repeat-containing protein [Polyangiaceae bacterium]
MRKLSALLPSLAMASLVVAAGCVAPVDTAQEVDAPEPEDVGSVTLPLGSTVLQASQSSCTTTSVKGLSEQIVAQMNCISPNAMAQVPKRPNLTFGSAAFPFMQSPAKDALVKALDANPSKSMTVNSMFRTVAQQYLLYRWGQLGKCGIGLAATPGNSNHESGLALDTSQYSTWKTPLTSQGFKWFGSADTVHFDYVGGGAKNLKGTDVLAFQMLWNLNNPGDKIGEDGDYGPQTEDRLKKSPADGFPKDPVCGTPSNPDADGDGVADASDNCPNNPNANQLDLDKDGAGDVCDADDDADGVDDTADNCPFVANSDQADSNGNGVGDACETDSDGDGVPNDVDVCPDVYDPEQTDTDGNGVGDACEGSGWGGGAGLGAGGASTGGNSGGSQGTQLRSGDSGGCGMARHPRDGRAGWVLAALLALLWRKRSPGRQRRGD